MPNFERKRSRSTDRRCAGRHLRAVQVAMVVKDGVIAIDKRQAASAARGPWLTCVSTAIHGLQRPAHDGHAISDSYDTGKTQLTTGARTWPRQDLNMVDLSLLVDGGHDLSGRDLGKLPKMSEISDDGHDIVGFGQNSANQEEGWPALSHP